MTGTPSTYCNGLVSEPPLVSVFIPTYNHEQYVEQTLNSFRDECWPNIEPFVHDDYSADNSWQVVSEWCDRNRHQISNLIVERAPQNRGITGSLNRLIDVANGEYTLSIGSDDALLPGGIERRLTALLNHPKWLAAFGDAIPINEAGEQMSESYLFKHFRSRRENRTSGSKRRMEMIVGWSVPGPAILHRKEQFNDEKGAGRYDPNTFVEDRDMSLRLLQTHQLGFIDSTLALYRLHESNIMDHPDLRIRGMKERAQPLLDAAVKPGLDVWERFVALHTVKALIAHANHRASNNPLKRLGYSLARAYHTPPARIIGELYLWFRK